MRSANLAFQKNASACAEVDCALTNATWDSLHPMNEIVCLLSTHATITFERSLAIMFFHFLRL
jgi:hypothetical protein